MIHILLLLLCVSSVEIFLKSNFLSILDIFAQIIKRIIHVIASKNISDHWKEKILPLYALRMMKYSLQILIILLIILFLFVTTNHFYNDLLNLIFSLIGIIESLIFSFGYLFLRKSIVR